MKLRLLVATALVASCVGAFAPTAQAGTMDDTAGAGVVAFTGTAQLNAFPSAATNAGSFEGTAAGAGVIGTTPFVLAGVGNMTAGFNYNEPCVSVEPFPLTGNATGNWGVGSVTGDSASGNFGWERFGLVAVIGGEVTQANSQSVSTGLAGVAVFVPDPLDLARLDHTCPNDGSELTATVVGAIAIASATPPAI